MLEIYRSFSTELKFYLITSSLFSFATGLSAVFLGVFLWQIDETYTLLAMYSLTWSVVIILSFGLCGWLARKTSPLFTMRIGFLFYILQFLIILYLHDSLDEHILLLGAINGLAMSMYYVGVHLSVLDLVKNENRDKYLFIQNVWFTVGAIVAPILSGYIIESHAGMTGYYIVFGITCLFLMIALFTSIKIKLEKVSQKSFFWEVLRNPSREWKQMYKVMVFDGIVAGAYWTFLVSIMTYQVTGGEMSLGIYQAATKMFTIVVLLYLAKKSSDEHRVKIFTIGAILLLISSAIIAMHPVLISLVIFGLLSTIASSMIGTSLNSMVYAAMEMDEHYQERKLDYIIIREFPLGLGRIIGVLLFLTIRNIFNPELLLPISFIVFPTIYLFVIPWVNKIWMPKGVISH